MEKIKKSYECEECGSKKLDIKVVGDQTVYTCKDCKFVGEIDSENFKENFVPIKGGKKNVYFD